MADPVTTDAPAAHPRPRRVAGALAGERLRAALTGPLVVMNTLGLTVAIQVHDAPAWAKGLLAASGSVGYLLAASAASIAHRIGWSTAQAYGCCFLAAAAGLACAAALPGAAAFTAGCAVALAAVSCAAPWTTAVWAGSIPAARRGRWYAGITQLEVLSGLAAVFACAWWIGGEPARYPWVLAVLAALVLAAAWSVRRIPAGPAPRTSANPLAGLRHLRDDRAFATVIGSYMLLGTANFAVLPLRVEHLAAGDALAYDAATVLVIVVAVPALARLVALPAWGRLFDRIDFLWMRALVNCCFAAAMLLFFTPWLWTQVLGSVILGCAFAGGDVSWRLWTVKLAPPERRADYNAVHIFLTGVRGVAGPFIGFHAAALGSAVAVAWAGAGVIAVATMCLLPRALRR